MDFVGENRCTISSYPPLCLAVRVAGVDESAVPVLGVRGRAILGHDAVEVGDVPSTTTKNAHAQKQTKEVRLNNILGNNLYLN